MYNLKQFREMTKDLPEDTEIRIESVFKPGQSFHTEVFEMICNAGQKKIVLLPAIASISDGENDLTVQHKTKSGPEL